MAATVTNGLIEIAPPASKARDACVAEKVDMHGRWAEFVAEQLCSLAIQSSHERRFRINAGARSAEGFVVARFTTVGGQAQLERTPAEIRRDGRDSYCLYVPLQGEHEMRQFCRDAVCTPRAATLIATGEPFCQTKLGDNDTLYLLMPRGFAEQRLPRCEDACARLVSSREGVGRLAFDTITSLYKEAPRLTVEEFLGAARVASDLVLLAVSGAADIMSDARSIRAGNLARAKRVIRTRFADPDLSLSDIARECGLSLRYLHDLFRDDGRTAREYLQGERLKAARSMLERSAARASTVTDVCLACGFSTPSQFSTTFKRTFGLSPRELLRRT
ncbi:MAG: helix-turn-helix domain-containing protein [Sinobacteraceae bacterium]|nr:helix-turn-helix domain-containing protein [Nevskiaceae bacterium]